MDFMTTEGDRSGIQTPTFEEKAQAKVRAALTRLNSKTSWTKEDISQATDDLLTARYYMSLVK